MHVNQRALVALFFKHHLPLFFFRQSLSYWPGITLLVGRLGWLKSEPRDLPASTFPELELMKPLPLMALWEQGVPPLTSQESMSDELHLRACRVEPIPEMPTHTFLMGTVHCLAPL